MNLSKFHIVDEPIKPNLVNLKFDDGVPVVERDDNGCKEEKEKNIERDKSKSYAE